MKTDLFTVRLNHSEIRRVFPQMSVKIMSKVWEHAPCRENSLIVLLALADWANDEGVCWPSMKTLADKARIDRRSAQRIVRKLKHEHLITIEEGGGRAKQHRYKVETAALCHPLEAAQNSDTRSAKRAALKAQRVTPEAQTATHLSPDPLDDPLDDPSVDPLRASHEIETWREKIEKQKRFAPNYDLGREIEAIRDSALRAQVEEIYRAAA